MEKINYNIKSTSANTDYLSLEANDMATIQITVLGLLTYMTELSISKDKDIRDFTKWFTTSDKRYHCLQRQLRGTIVLCLVHQYW